MRPRGGGSSRFNLDELHGTLLCRHFKTGPLNSTLFCVWGTFTRLSVSSMGAKSFSFLADEMMLELQITSSCLLHSGNIFSAFGKYSPTIQRKLCVFQSPGKQLFFPTLVLEVKPSWGRSVKCLLGVRVVTLFVMHYGTTSCTHERQQRDVSSECLWRAQDDAVLNARCMIIRRTVSSNMCYLPSLLLSVSRHSNITPSGGFQQNNTHQ